MTVLCFCVKRNNSDCDFYHDMINVNLNTSTIAGLNISEASFKARLPKTGLPFLTKGIQKKLASFSL